jgi:hypothetical protein
MRLLGLKNMARIGVLAILVVIGMPFDAFSQGRGRDRGGDNSGLGRKCDKFVNCHDARDGRWDGRGPRNRGQWDNRNSWRRRRDRDDNNNRRSRRRYDNDRDRRSGNHRQR